MYRGRRRISQTRSLQELVSAVVQVKPIIESEMRAVDTWGASAKAPATYVIKQRRILRMSMDRLYVQQLRTALREAKDVGTAEEKIEKLIAALEAVLQYLDGQSSGDASSGYAVYTDA